jgi:hypothetical protein
MNESFVTEIFYWNSVFHCKFKYGVRGSILGRASSGVYITTTTTTTTTTTR